MKIELVGKNNRAIPNLLRGHVADSEYEKLIKLGILPKLDGKPMQFSFVTETMPLLRASRHLDGVSGEDLYKACRHVGVKQQKMSTESEMAELYNTVLKGIHMKWQQARNTEDMIKKVHSLSHHFFPHSPDETSLSVYLSTKKVTEMDSDNMLIVPWILHPLKVRLTLKADFDSERKLTRLESVTNIEFPHIDGEVSYERKTFAPGIHLDCDGQCIESRKPYHGAGLIGERLESMTVHEGTYEMLVNIANMLAEKAGPAKKYKPTK